MKRFYCIETGEYITQEQLEKEYQEFRQEGTATEENFSEYLNNCMTENNGSLDTLETRAKDLSSELARFARNCDFTDRYDADQFQAMQEELTMVTNWIKKGGK